MELKHQILTERLQKIENQLYMYLYIRQIGFLLIIFPVILYFAGMFHSIIINRMEEQISEHQNYVTHILGGIGSALYYVIAWFGEDKQSFNELIKEMEYGDMYNFNYNHMRGLFPDSIYTICIAIGLLVVFLMKKKITSIETDIEEVKMKIIT